MIKSNCMCQDEPWQFQRPWQAHPFQKHLVQKLSVFTKRHSKCHSTVSTLSLVWWSRLPSSSLTSQLGFPELRLSCKIGDWLVSNSSLLRTFGLYFVIVFVVGLWTNWAWTTCVIHMQSSPSMGRIGVGLQEHSKTVPATSVWRHGPCWTHPCSGQESQKSWQEKETFLGQLRDAIFCPDLLTY